MAFWGIEVKPSKPVVHSCEKARGRLRISQATLGIGGAAGKSIVQCIVGKRSPILICALLPNQTESCHLELDFEEADDVIFSVIGPRSVYLTGYYVCKSQQSNPHSDSESYGVDIENSQTEESNHDSEDDEYEDSFIDDDDELQIRSPSPVSSSKEVDETTPEDDNVNNQKGGYKRLKKRRQVVESDDDDDNSCGSDDGYLFSIFKGKNTPNNACTGAEENISQEKGEKLKTNDACSSKSKEQFDLEQVNGREKPGKKRKERPEEEKTFEVQIDEGKEQKVEASTKIEVGDGCLLPPPELSCKRSKKRRKEGDSTMNDNGQKNDDDVKSAVGSQPEKKIKKKKNKRAQAEGDLGSGLPNTIANEMPMGKRTLSNGLIIEELANGPPNGKVAAPGKKVKIYYTAMLKDNGHVFDSNVGKTVCKFRLGDEGIMDGWNLGIDGMRIGDKRRLIIPPYMGCGKHGAAENVPPESWLVYDVELVGIRNSS